MTFTYITCPYPEFVYYWSQMSYFLPWIVSPELYRLSETTYSNCGIIDHLSESTEILGNVMFPWTFSCTKLRPILYHPVSGNVAEISEFPLLGHTTTTVLQLSWNNFCSSARFHCSYCPWFLLFHDYCSSYCSMVPWFHGPTVPCVPLFLLFHGSKVPLVPMFLLLHGSTVPTRFHCSYCSMVLLFHGSKVPLFLLFPMVRFQGSTVPWFLVPTVPCSTVPTVPWFHGSYCSMVPTLCVVKARVWL